MYTKLQLNRLAETPQWTFGCGSVWDSCVRVGDVLLYLRNMLNAKGAKLCKGLLLLLNDQLSGWGIPLNSVGRRTT